MNAYRIASQSLIQLPRSIQNRHYLDFVRKLPCCVSGRIWGVDAAHTGGRGLSQKSSDLDCIPLNREFHRPGYPNSYHELGRREFERFHRVNIRKIIGNVQARAAAAGVDLSRSDTPRKSVGRSGGLKKRGAA